MNGKNISIILRVIENTATYDVTLCNTITPMDEKNTASILISE